MQQCDHDPRSEARYEPEEHVVVHEGIESADESITYPRCVGGEYDPDAFDPNAIVFDNPRKRWKKAFER